MAGEKRFGNSIFGFKKSDVNSYIEKILMEFDDKLKEKDNEIVMLKSQNKEIKGKYEEFGKKAEQINEDRAKIGDVLIKAQEKAELMVSEAKIQALEEKKKLDEIIEREKEKLVDIKDELKTLKSEVVSTSHRRVLAPRSRWSPSPACSEAGQVAEEHKYAPGVERLMLRNWTSPGLRLGPSVILLTPGASSMTLPVLSTGSCVGLMDVSGWNTRSSCCMVPVSVISRTFTPAVIVVGICTRYSDSSTGRMEDDHGRSAEEPDCELGNSGLVAVRSLAHPRMRMPIPRTPSEPTTSNRRNPDTPRPGTNVIATALLAAASIHNFV